MLSFLCYTIPWLRRTEKLFSRKKKGPENKHQPINSLLEAAMSWIRRDLWGKNLSNCKFCQIVFICDNPFFLLWSIKYKSVTVAWAWVLVRAGTHSVTFAPIPLGGCYIWDRILFCKMLRQAGFQSDIVLLSPHVAWITGLAKLQITKNWFLLRKSFSITCVENALKFNPILHVNRLDINMNKFWGTLRNWIITTDHMFSLVRKMWAGTVQRYFCFQDSKPQWALYLALG